MEIKNIHENNKYFSLFIQGYFSKSDLIRRKNTKLK